MGVGSPSVTEESRVEKVMKERFFSVELKSRTNLRNIALSNGGYENVLVEGTIGQLRHATFIDGVVLEIVGDRGVLRINLTRDEIKEKEKPEKEAKIA